MIKFGNGNWAVKNNKTLAYDESNGRFKTLAIRNSRFTHGSYKNRSGALIFDPAMTSRIDFENNPNGDLLSETQSTQRVSNSENFGSGEYNKLNMSQEQTVEVSAPNSNMIVTKLTNTSPNASLRKQFGQTSNRHVCLSLFVKKGNTPFVGWRMSNNNGFTYAIFDLDNSTIVKTETTNTSDNAKFSFAKYKNGWFRIKVDFLENGTGSGSFVNTQDFKIFESSTSDSTSAGFFCYVTGYQREFNNNVSSYFRVAGQNLTRTNDNYRRIGNCEYNLPNLANGIENGGTIIWKVSIAGKPYDSTSRFITLQQTGTTGSTTNKSFVSLKLVGNFNGEHKVGGQYHLGLEYMFSNTVISASKIIDDPEPNRIYNIGFSFMPKPSATNGNECIVSVDGITNTDFPSAFKNPDIKLGRQFNDLLFMKRGGQTNTWNGRVKEILILDEPKSQTELNLLTLHS
ncbi:MAG: hypothetical protein Unbinned5858contig1001_7 [Prokaryotic dsDNA virus sp.]|nr:MAG: hypothetical protein Unbinned5858contig1001_7 [Prokaryotic dsDNA virus sp.]|tara:strand:+ start:737 stop:2104 length:1368 start_codon:yes stop_codon:yes gene_type:complete